MRFNELVKLLEQNGFEIIREKGSIRYYSKAGLDKLIRIDYHGSERFRLEPVMPSDVRQ